VSTESLQAAASVRAIRLPFLALLAVAATIVAAGLGCGDSDDDAAPTGATSSPQPPPPGTSTPTETGGIDPLEGAGTDPVIALPTSDTTALLEHVAIGRHEGFDRVVFRFRNVVPGYRITYVDPPLVEDGSGARVDVEGNAFVLIRMEPASGFDLETAEGVLVYKGPRRLSGAEAGTSVVREVVRTGDFEAVLSWAVGLDDRVDFRVTMLQGPPRLVVDFRNH
jgi:hypothetical protein